MGTGRLGNDQRLHSIWKRQNNDRRKTPIDRTRTPDEVIAANVSRRQSGEGRYNGARLGSRMNREISAIRRIFYL
jgi:hypothetical protein